MHDKLNIHSSKFCGSLECGYLFNDSVQEILDNKFEIFKYFECLKAVRFKTL